MSSVPRWGRMGWTQCEGVWLLVAEYNCRLGESEMRSVREHLRGVLDANGFEENPVLVTDQSLSYYDRSPAGSVGCEHNPARGSSWAGDIGESVYWGD